MNIHLSFHELNWLAIVVAALSTFGLGGLWYSPVLFEKIWMKEAGITVESQKSANMVKIFGLSFLLAMVASLLLGLFLGEDAGGGVGALSGFLIGLGTIFTFLGIIYLFERRSFAHFLVNASYGVAALTLMGFIIGVWQ
jgi:F0F1-type ATP synthase assembly protein I